MKSKHDFKDSLILTSWIAGILILLCLVWILSSPLQANYLLRAVNNVFISNNDHRRITSYIPPKSGKQDLFGYWYMMYNSTDLMFVFTVFQNGILVPLGAVVSDNGVVKEIIPLSAHAVQTADMLPQSILQMYTSRIEASLKTGVNNKGQVR
jgi:hypothetical protein